VKLEQCSALDLTLKEDDVYDTIVLNSVIQYFPDAKYLESVIERAVGWLPSGGRIFVGDVRNFALLSTFHCSVQLAKATSDTTVAQLKNRIGRSIDQEKELVIDPRFFHELLERIPAISNVQISLKTGSFDNELTRYRYDVVLHVGQQQHPRDDNLSFCLEASANSVASLSKFLHEKHPPLLVYRGIANRRLSHDLSAQRILNQSHATMRVEQVRTELDRTENRGEYPEEFLTIAGTHGYQATITWSSVSDEGAFDVEFKADQEARAVQVGAVAFRERATNAQPERLSVAIYANDPMANRLKQQLVPELRNYVGASLPTHMIPSSFVILDEFPLSPNGKLDRMALPAPEMGSYSRQQFEAPLSELEEGLTSVWQEVLRVPRIGRNDDFFELGGHSLLAIRMLAKVNQLFGCKLSVGDVYSSPTVKDLTARVRGDVHTDEAVDLQRETILDKRIAPPTGQVTYPESAILLTGATGFVGRFLLAQLLHDSQSVVYCLVRASSQLQATARVKSTLREWGLWRADFENRVIGVPGDLGLAQLGVSAGLLQVLCDRVDSIYHCGTSMNHLETYSMAKPANVGGAREILRIASNGRPKLINYISTVGSFQLYNDDSTRIVDETTSIDQERHLHSQGYAASKWVSEKLFMMAADRGFACNIFRLGLVWADSELGRYDQLQRGYRLFKSCLKSGFGIQGYSYEMPPTPVDYVVRAISYLATRHRAGLNAFHVSATDEMNVRLFERCNEIAGTAFELLPHFEWIDTMKRLRDAGTVLPVVPLIDYAFSMTRHDFESFQKRIRLAGKRFDCTRTRSELEAVGIVAPVLDDFLLKRYLEAMWSRDSELRSLAPSRGSKRGRGQVRSSI